jgi:hypothetical protein
MFSMRGNISSCTLHAVSAAYVIIRHHTSAYVSICGATSTLIHSTPFLQHTSSYVSIRQHTSAYAGQHQLLYTPSRFCSIRQHTSAYVSMRQHTSAYEGQHQLLYTPSRFCSSCGVSICTFVLAKQVKLVPVSGSFMWLLTVSTTHLQYMHLLRTPSW